MFKLATSLEEPITAMVAVDSSLYLAVKSKLVIFNLLTDKTTEIKAHKKGIVCMVVAQHDGDTIILTGSKDKSIKAWNLSNHVCTGTFYGHKEPVTAVAKDKANLYSGSSDNTIRVWLFETGECTHLIKTDATPTCLQISPQTNTLFVRTQACAVYSFKLSDKGMHEKKVVFPDNVGSMLLGDNILFLGWEDNTIRLYNIESESSVKVLVGHQKQVETMSYIREALFSAAKGEVRVWNVVNGQIRFLATAEECYCADLFCVAESKIGTVMVCVAADRCSIFELPVKDIIKNTKLSNVVEACNKETTTVVDLTRCDLANFPEYEIDKPQIIQSIKLSHNKLQALPPGIKEFKKLKELLLADNVLTRLQPEVCMLKLLRKLDISDNYLISLPQQLGRLVALEELIISKNEISVLPAEIGALTNLTILDASHNRLSSLPREMANLRKLVKLFIDNNSFSDTISEVADVSSDIESPHKAASPTRRRSSHRNSTSLSPPSHQSGTRRVSKSTSLGPGNRAKLGKATDMVVKASTNTHMSRSSAIESDTEALKRHSLSLDYIGSQVAIVDFKWDQLIALQILHLQNNRLTKVPPSISQVTSLTELNISNNFIKKLTISLSQLKALRKLHLSKNAIQALPADISELAKLKELWIDGNKLQELPPKFENLHSLKLMRASDNHLRILPLDFGRLVNLREVYLDGNGLTEFPAELTSLQSLKLLNLDNNHLITLPTELYFMSSLVSLSCKRNKIKRIPYYSMAHLQKLFLDENEMNEIKADITSMKNLAEISLSKNRISTVSPDIGFCSSLTKIDLSHNDLVEVPPTIALLPRLRILNLVGNLKLRSPPASIIESQNTEAIVEHLAEAAFTSTKPSYESTIIFVGLEGAGKTSVLQRLKTNKFQKKPRPTKGIVMDELSTKFTVKKDGKKIMHKIRFTVWDFSGHEDYFSLHQFFFTERAIYCIVWDLGLDESRSQIDWYLNSIRVHAGSAPVIIVATHWDSVKDADAVMLQLEKKYMNSKYPNLHYIVGVSCVTGLNTDVLMEKLTKLAKNRPYMGEKVPSSFLKLAQLVQKERQTMKTPLVELADFQKMAQRCNIDKSTFSAALHYLHQTGVIVNLSATTFDNFGAVVLDPQWLARTLTLLFSQRKQFLADGLLHHENLEKIWSEADVPSLFHYGYIAMVHRLELAFEEGATTKKVSRNFYTNVSIIPTLLPTTPAKTPLWPKYSAKPEYVRLYKLGFVPFGLMGRLMSRVFRKVKPVAFWRDGFYVEELVEHLPGGSTERQPNNLAKVEVIAKSSSLKVTVRGTKPVAFMKIITDLIDQLIKRWYYFPRIQVSSYVAYVNQEDPSDDNVYIFPLAHIENEFKKGSATIKYNQLEVKLSDLLPDIQSRLSRVLSDDEL